MPDAGSSEHKLTAVVTRKACSSHFDDSCRAMPVERMEGELVYPKSLDE